MPFDLYLIGHGCYRSRNMEIDVPQNYSFKFYTKHATGLPEADLQTILRGNGTPVRTYNAGERMPNYTWQNGETQNWDWYVTGKGPDRRKRQGLSQNIGDNAHLKLNRRGDDWDVRYVQYFKTLAGRGMMTEYTLEELLTEPAAITYFTPKTTPITVHVLFCLVLDQGPKKK